MIFVAICSLILTLVIGTSSEDALADKRLKRIIGAGIGLGIGAAIVNDFNKKRRRAGSVQAGPRVDPRQKWQDIAAVNGRGTTVCHSDEANYYCLALRCGKGRGLEFAWLFSGGSIENGRQVPVRVDGELVETLTVNAVEPTSELVFAYEPDRHGHLIDRLKGGRTVSLTFDNTLTLSLRGSSKALNKTMKMCASEIGGGALLAKADNPSPKAADSTDLSWREDDTEQSYVARIREAAISYGGPCNEEQAVFERLQRDIKVDVKQSEVRAGEFVTVEWSGNTLDQLIPAYLVVATDAAVRFKGEGFYALMPDAIGPFGIETFKEQTRAIVALYGEGALKAGKIEIEGILAGNMPLEMAVIGWQRKCQLETAQVFDLGSVKVKPAAAPVIDLDDRLVSDRPDKYLINADGTRLIEERDDGTWRLLDNESLTVILDGPGIEPRFSETGRFAGVVNEDEYQIFDVIDGHQILSGAGELEWGNHDSFLAISFHSWGAFVASNTLSTDVGFGGGSGPRAESGGGLPVLDLENNLAVSGDGGKSIASRIDLPKISVTGPGVNYDVEVLNFDNIKLSPFIVSGFLGRHRYAQDYRHRRSHSSFYASLRQKNCPECDEPTYNHRSVFVEKVELAARDFSVSQTIATNSNSTLTRSAALISTYRNNVQSKYPLGMPGLNTLPVTAASHIENVLEGAETSHDRPGSEQISLGNKIRQRVSTEIPASSAYFGNAFDDYGVDYAVKYLLGGEPFWLMQLVMTGGNAGFYNSHLKIVHNRMDPEYYSIEFDHSTLNIGTGCSGSLAYCKVETTAFADQYLALWSAEARAVAIFDSKLGKLVFKKFDLPRGDLLKDVALTVDSKHLIQQNSDGSFFVHRIIDGETVLEGRIVDDEVVVWTPDMRFDSTAEGAHFVNLRFPGQIGQYTFQQFNSRLRVPGLVQKVLSGEYRSQPVEVGVPPQLSGSLDVADGRILGVVTPQSLGDLRGIRVYQDGVLTDEVLALESDFAVEIDVKRLNGTRWVSLVAVDEDGLVSLPVGRDLGADKDLAKVRLLAVGVDQYDDERIQDLGLAKADAFTLSDSLDVANGKTIDLVQKTVLPDGDATPEAVLAAARRLVADAKPGEQAVFFFAGHGVKGEDGRFYMATSATDPENISGTALSWDQLSAVLANSKARMTVFLDACHSGAAGTDFFATNDDAASGILKNIPSGLTVFSASKGRELSEENTALGGGQFTKAVASVIATDRPVYDLNQNGVIEVSELYVGVKRQVVERTEGRQTPWLARNQMVGDFALF